MRAHSVSTSYASFEAELEGAILQHTGAVDYFLETSACKWSIDTGDHATPHKLRSAFLADLNSSLWQAFAYARVQGEDSPFDNEQLLGGPMGPVPASIPERINPAQLSRPTKRRPRTQPLQVGTESRLEQYLQQQVSHLRGQLDSGNLQSLAADSQSYSSISSGTASFVKPPVEGAGKADTATAAVQVAAPVAVAQAAAMAATTCASAFGDITGLQLLSKASTGMAAVPALLHPAVTEASSSTAAEVPAASTAGAEPLAAAQAAVSAAGTPFAMEDDDVIAAQKQAARARLAELEGRESTAGSSTAAEAAEAAPASKAISRKGPAVPDDDSFAGSTGNVHSSLVPERPRGLTRAARAAAKSANEAYNGTHYNGGLATSGGAMMPHCSFSQTMMMGMLLCMVLVAVSWMSQRWSTGGSSIMQLPVVKRLQAYGTHLYVPTAAAALLYTLSTAWMSRPPLLHFTNPEREAQYLAWSNTGKLFVDCLFQVLFLVVGGCLWMRLQHTEFAGEEQESMRGTTLLAVVSMMGSGLPVLLLLLLRSARYMQWREHLLAGSRLCSVAALAVMQLSFPSDCAFQLPYGMPFVALAQLMGVACMQVRLATFVPCQVAHLLVLLFKTQATNPLLHFAQLFGGGLCLPCLLLRSMEIYSRKAFLATVGTPGPKHKQL